MKIALYTSYQSNPMHPRTELLKKLLEESHDLDIIHVPFQNSIINRISFGYFNILSLKDLNKSLSNYDLIFIQDLKLLPLAILAKIKKKPVIYETLDNNVYLNFYFLTKKYLILKYLHIVRLFFTFIEKALVHFFTNRVIVNSKALKKFFNNKAEIIFYSSLLEGIDIKKDLSGKKPGFLYLGWFSESKGAVEIIALIDKYRLPLYLIGSINDSLLLERILNHDLIHYYSHLDYISLREKLEVILSENALFGLSLIKSTNLSYATQEANKDIDYLCLGIPIMGNTRQPTKEKIDVGLGLNFEDEERFQEVLGDKSTYNDVSVKCKQYYDAHYATSIFKEKLFNILKDVQGDN